MMRRDIDPAREHERALSALWHLDAGTDRAEWVRLGMAAQAAGIDFEDWHSSLVAACDVVLEVVRNDDRREWKLAKSKDGADDVAHPFRLDVVDIGTDPEDGEPITSCVVVPEERAADAVRRVNLPVGGNQRIIYDALGELLRQSKHFGMAGAPPTRPCIELEDAINRTRDRLVCDPKRRTERTREAFTGLVSRGAVTLREGWLWLS